MPEISTAKPSSIQSRSRIGRALLAAAKTLLISFLRTIYALWLEVTGLIFAFLVILGASDLIRHYRADHHIDSKRLVSVSGFILVCAWFTVISYVRAKKTRK
jgi:hypothetical protein